MKRKWYAVWPKNVPKVFKPEKSVPEYLKEMARASPNKTALSYYGFDMSYADLDKASDSLANSLVNLGINKGDRVALFMENCPQFVISYFGILRAGAIVVAVSPMFKHTELEYEINDSGAKTIISLDIFFPEISKAAKNIKLNNIILTSLLDFLPTEPNLPLTSEMNKEKVIYPNTIDFLELLKKSSTQLLPKIDLNDIALFQYTGGTTGLPKGAMLSHYSLAHNSVGATLWFGYKNYDIHIGVAPFFHVIGMIQGMCASLMSGGQLVVLTRFSPEIIAQVINEYRCTIWHAATTMIIAMLAWPKIDLYDISSLSLVWFGGTPMPSEILTRFQKMVPAAKLGEGYGLTECLSAGGTITPMNRPKLGTMGIPNISMNIKIVDLKSGLKEVMPNEEGEIVIKGPAVMKGYWNRHEETRQTLRNGWLYTGDIGKMDDEGYVTMVGRKKELIKCSGYSVFPAEVEGLLYTHPAIAETAVIGISDSYRGETPKAFIVLKPEYKGIVKESDIVEWAKENMATYKRPRLVEFRNELPKNAAGKVLRRILTEEELQKGEKSLV